MLGFLPNYKVAELNYWPDSDYFSGDWHLAIHQNNHSDTISYHFFNSKEEAIRFALKHGIRMENVYISKGKNGQVKDSDVTFTCFHCRKKFTFGGAVIDYGEHQFSICRLCAIKLLKMTE